MAQEPSYKAESIECVRDLPTARNRFNFNDLQSQIIMRGDLIKLSKKLNIEKRRKNKVKSNSPAK